MRRRSLGARWSSPGTHGGDDGLPVEMVTAAPNRAQLFAPIVANERLVGALIVVWCERGPTCGRRELGMVDAMASQAGIALENARLFEEDRRKLAELSTLYELSRAVTGQLEHRPAGGGRPPRGGASARRPQPRGLPVRESRPPRAGDRAAEVGRGAGGGPSRAAVRSGSGWRAPSSPGALPSARRTTPRRARAGRRRARRRVAGPASLARRADDRRGRGAGRPDAVGGHAPVHGGRRAAAHQHRGPVVRSRSAAPSSPRNARATTGADARSGPPRPDRAAPRARRDGGRRRARLQQPARGHRGPCGAAPAARTRDQELVRGLDDPPGGARRRSDGAARSGSFTRTRRTRRRSVGWPCWTSSGRS